MTRTKREPRVFPFAVGERVVVKRRGQPTRHGMVIGERRGSLGWTAVLVDGVQHFDMDVLFCRRTGLDDQQAGENARARVVAQYPTWLEPLPVATVFVRHDAKEEGA